MKSLVLILCALLCSPVRGQIQIMEPRKLKVLQSYIPKIADHPNIQAKLAQAMVYTDVEVPPAYQFQPARNGVGVDYTVFFSPYFHLDNNTTQPTNGNMEEPWKDPGGTALVDPGKVSSFKLLWLPPRPEGGVYPIVVWRGRLQPMLSNIVLNGVLSKSMPAPENGWRWMWPADAIMCDILLKVFSDGSWACYAMRARLREVDDWDVEVYVPFESLDALKKYAGNVEGRIASRTIQDSNHANMAFHKTFSVYELPPIPNAGRALRSLLFKPMLASEFLLSGNDRIFAPTAFDDDNIVPANYLGAGIGTDRDSCLFCHRDTLAHVEKFDANRPWYGYRAGSDGINSFHPFEPSCIGPPEKQPVLRKAFVDAGMVSMYDPAIHPSSVYQVAKLYENP